jgi:peroxiredoxin (alkyl hydroperoxide reductase subunit C)
MKRSRVLLLIPLFLAALAVSDAGSAYGRSEAFKGNIYETGKLKPVDSVLRVTVGEPAPDFTLPAISGERVTLSQYRGKKHVVISFVPAAWTPVCSDQWPGYAILEDLFKEHDAVLLGITVDNIPTLFAWTNQMGKIWFPVLSDFWPHGKVADSFGVLRSDGTAERAIIIIDKEGIMRYINVNDINKRPFLESIVEELEKLGR